MKLNTSRRVDIFLHDTNNHVSTWHCYVQAVTPTNAINIIESLERQGEQVAAFIHAKSLGKMVYETA